MSQTKAPAAHSGWCAISGSESLLDAPRAYPLVPRYEHFGIRRRPFGRYLIFYRIGQDAIEIIHILHGARDDEAILFPQD